MTRPRVLIFGGGVAGLTAAHELCERNFDVTVFEARHWGGKIRSMGKTGTGVDGRKDLPGEHGFHFFPTFYKHIPDTMKRIPFGEGTVFDNLVTGQQELVARAELPQIIVPSNFDVLHNVEQLVQYFRALHAGLAGIPGDEFEVFMNRVLKVMTACDERRIAEFDNISWADFIEAEKMGPAYQQLLSRLPALLLIAVDPTKASARTLGNACIGMFHAGFGRGGNVERSLNGPPSEKWGDPWVAYLADKTNLQFGAELTGLQFDAVTNRIASATVTQDGAERKVEGDFYICALPLEAAIPHLNSGILAAAPSLQGISQLSVGWMNGLQYFLNRPLPLISGHIAYETSAWALTSVCQSQFWKNGVDFSSYGTGELREVLSVIISDWDTPGTEVVRKPASCCTPAELFQETLAQLNAALCHKVAIACEQVDIQPIPEDAIIDTFLDPDIQFPWNAEAPCATADQQASGVHRSNVLAPAAFSAKFRAHNAEPLYITTTGAWALRPEAVTAIPNFFVASDYVRNVADFASAEGANEAGRKAANGVLQESQSPAPPVPIWHREEIAIFAPFHLADRVRFDLGLPQHDLPEPARAVIRQVLDCIL